MKKYIYMLGLVAIILGSRLYLTKDSFSWNSYKPDKEDVEEVVTGTIETAKSAKGKVSELINDYSNNESEAGDQSEDLIPVRDYSTLNFDVPKYIGQAHVSISFSSKSKAFDDKMLVCEPYEEYSKLDALGRCGSAMAIVCKETMPTEERGEIGHIKPSGWHTVKYPDTIPDKYLYNRCHLIGFQLTGENDNERNLITGTRYMNIDGMLDLENSIADYVHNTGNHVAYRVTPIFKGDELLCRGVLMEAYSIEDNGKGINFCEFAFNVQPGIEIDYATGDSYETGLNINLEEDSDDSNDLYNSFNDDDAVNDAVESVLNLISAYTE